MAVLACCGIAVALMQTIVVPILPRLPGLLDVSAQAASWLVTSTLLASAVGAPLLGRLGDMYGKRRTLLISLGMLVAGSALAAAGGTFPAALAGRVLQGLAMAAIPLGISIMRDVLPPERIGSAIGFMSSTLGVGGAIGLPLSATVIEHTSWRTMFAGAAVLGVLDMLLVLRLVPESRVRTGGRFDLFGAVGLTIALLCLLLAISRGQAWGWTSPPTLGLFAIAIAVLPLWSRYQLRVRQPLVDLRVSARRPVLLTNIAAVLTGFAMYAGFMATAQLLQAPPATGYGQGASLATAGLLMMPGGLAMVFFSPVSARLSNRYGPRFPLLVGASVMAVGYCVFATGFHSVGKILLSSTLTSIGAALAYSAMPAIIMRSVPTTETASANSLNTLMRAIGTSSCSAVVGTILSSVTMTVGSQILPRGQAFVLIFVLGAATALLGGIIALRLPR